MEQTPVLVDVVLVGGGHAQVYVLKMFGMKPVKGVRLTLVTKNALTPYSGMLPGHIAGCYTKEECHVDLVRLANFAGARCIISEVVGINREAKTIDLKDRPSISYDVLSIDIGSTPTSMQDAAAKQAAASQQKQLKLQGSTERKIHDPDADAAGKEQEDGFVLTPALVPALKAASSSSSSGATLSRKASDDSANGSDNKAQKQATNNPSTNTPGAVSDPASDAGSATADAQQGDEISEEETRLMSIVTAVKPIDGFSARWDVICNAVRNAPPGKVFRLAVVGGGAGGVELALAMHFRLQRTIRDRPDSGKKVTLSTTLLTRGPTILASHNKRVQQSVLRILRSRGIDVQVQREAVAVLPHPPSNSAEGLTAAGLLQCTDGSTHPFDECVWCTQARGAPWLRTTGLELDEQGFIKVEDTLESVNSPLIFACGDIAAVVNQPRPKAGVYAVRQGQPLFDNLKRAALGQKLKPFVQQKQGLAIIGCGDGYAVASKGSWLKLEGAWVWKVKDWIDKKWMSMYSDLPDIEEMMEAMKSTASPLDSADSLAVMARAKGPDALHVLSHAAMRCGGCGSKVGATVLSKVMQRLRTLGLLVVPPGAEKAVLVGLDDPDDAAVIRPPQGDGHVTVHTVDFFRSFIDDPYIFGQVAANHALSDCHAMCADAQTALAIVTVPFGLAKEVEETIFQVMAGACDVLREAGCALVGGHTAEGVELCLGFCVNGVAREDQVLHKGGMAAGDKVIITKSVGTGALFAAHMRGLIEGPAVINALHEMRKSNQQAARILRDVGSATCCTDITGFGVVGHLGEMLRASDDNDKFNQHFLIQHKYFGASLDLDALPVLRGAHKALSYGVTSSLQAANLTSRRSLVGATKDSPTEQALRSHPSFPLLFDPQTAGGLLATVPAAKADAVVAALRDIGFAEACVLGSVTEVPSTVERIHVSTSRTDTSAAPAKRRPGTGRQLGGVAAAISAIIWPENARKGTGRSFGRFGTLLTGVFLGIAVACAVSCCSSNGTEFWTAPKTVAEVEESSAAACVGRDAVLYE